MYISVHGCTVDVAASMLNVVQSLQRGLEERSVSGPVLVERAARQLGIGACVVRERSVCITAGTR